MTINSKLFLIIIKHMIINDNNNDTYILLEVAGVRPRASHTMHDTNTKHNHDNRNTKT